MKRVYSVFIITLILTVFYLLFLKQTPPVERVLPHKIYALGDSLTLSYPLSDEHFIWNTLTSKLGNDWTVSNKGVGGQTTSQMLERFNKESLEGFGYVVVWGGTNDIYKGRAVSDITADLQSIYDYAHIKGLKVVSINIPPHKTSVGWDENKQFTTDTVNEWIKSSNADYKIDIYSLLESKVFSDRLQDRFNGGDMVHLSKEAYTLVSDELYKVFFKL